MHYICIRNQATRALSSAGSEHLVYTQRVGGSNPSAPTIKTETLPPTKGRLAQLVQSIWFTPRGSGVRIPQRPQPKKAKRRREKDKPVSIKHLQVFSLYFSSQKMTPKSQKKIEKSY